MNTDVSVNGELLDCTLTHFHYFPYLLIDLITFLLHG